jgi:hypothetical protein
MKINNKHAITAIVTAAFISVSGCSSFSEQHYTYVVDNDRLTPAPSLTRTAVHTGHVVWLNPPTKRVALNKEQK